MSVVCAGRQEYQQQVPRDQSLLHNLMAARRKDTNQPLSDAQICAQAFTFILAGGSSSKPSAKGICTPGHCIKLYTDRQHTHMDAFEAGKVLRVFLLRCLSQALYTGTLDLQGNWLGLQLEGRHTEFEQGTGNIHIHPCHDYQSVANLHFVHMLVISVLFFSHSVFLWPLHAMCKQRASCTMCLPPHLLHMFPIPLDRVAHATSVSCYTSASLLYCAVYRGRQQAWVTLGSLITYKCCFFCTMTSPSVHTACCRHYLCCSSGYETTSTALTYALYELSRHPGIQQRVVEEVDQFGREREPQFGDLAHFPLIDAVLKEGMRLHPPVTPLIALVNSPVNPLSAPQSPLIALVNSLLK